MNGRRPVSCALVSSALAFVLVGCNAILGIQDPIDEPSSDSAATTDAGFDTTRDAPENGGADTKDAGVESAGDDTFETSVDSGLDTSAGDSIVDATDTAPPPPDAPCVSAYVTAVLADGPIAYWHLDETSGTTAKDAVGAHDGSYTAMGVTLGAPPAIKCGTAAHFSTGAMTSSSVPSFGPSAPFTVEAWLALDNVDTTTRYVFGRYAASTGGWALFEDIVNGSDFTRSNTTAVDEAVADVLIASTWTYYVATFDGTNLVVYIDGKQKISLASAATLTTAALDFTLGAPGNGLSLPMSGGAFDEVAIYDKALTSLVIGNHYLAGSK